MFTGIIEEVGRIRSVVRRQGALRVRIHRPGSQRDLAPGDSIAVDGVCLTVVARGRDWFEAEISPETCSRSTLGAARAGRSVNLERPLAASGRLGGHFVQGHVDASGSVRSIRRAGAFVEMAFGYPAALRGLLVEKGSIAVNGVSLTIASMTSTAFTAALIPHTLEGTNLGTLKPSDAVNLEVDILAKYVRALLDR